MRPMPSPLSSLSTARPSRRTAVRIALPVALVTALTAAAVGAGTLPADARAKRGADSTAPVISAIAINPSPLVLAVKKGGHTSFKIAVRVADDSGVDRVTVGLYDPSDSNGRAFRLAHATGSVTEGRWTGTLKLPNTSRTGTYAVRAFATDLASNTTDPDVVYTNLRVLNKTRTSKFAISVDPRTGVVTASALLERFRRGKAWEPFTAREMTLEFQPKGATSFETVATAKTNAKGEVSFGKVKASASGSWRVAFAGHPSYAPSSTKAKVVNLPSS